MMAQISSVLSSCAAFSRLYEIYGGGWAIWMLVLGERSKRALVEAHSQLPANLRLMDIDRKLLKDAHDEMHDAEHGPVRRAALYALCASENNHLKRTYYAERIASQFPRVTEWGAALPCLYARKNVSKLRERHSFVNALFIDFQPRTGACLVKILVRPHQRRVALHVTISLIFQADEANRLLDLVAKARGQYGERGLLFELEGDELFNLLVPCKKETSEPSYVGGSTTKHYVPCSLGEAELFTLPFGHLDLFEREMSRVGLAANLNPGRALE